MPSEPNEEREPFGIETILTLMAQAESFMARVNLALAYLAQLSGDGERVVGAVIGHKEDDHG